MLAKFAVYSATAFVSVKASSRSVSTASTLAPPTSCLSPQSTTTTQTTAGSRSPTSTSGSRMTSRWVVGV